MISTRDLANLPGIDDLRRTLQSMAMLDAILCPDWSGRSYSFNASWSGRNQMGSMRDGCGDEFFALFNPAGCWLKGFAHESPMSPYRGRPPSLWPGIIEAVPPEFAECLREPAFNLPDTTFCTWRCQGDPSWQVGPVAFPTGSADPDGSEGLLSPLDGVPETYHAWAEDYYERGVSLAAVRLVYQHRPLTADLIAALNPEIEPDDLRTDLDEIGYPTGGRPGSHAA